MAGTFLRGLALLAAVGALAGCHKKSCLEGTAAACTVVSPCERLSFTCEGGSARVFVLGPGDPIPAGLDALAAPGDVVLENDQVVAVIDALDHPHHLAPTGGVLIDLALRGGEDSLNQALVATGLLPGDSARYTELRLVEEPSGARAVVVRGHLDGDPEHWIATRYEIRPCEPGIRVRTEVVNRARDPAIWAVTDGWFWGGRDLLPFVPLPGSGFEHPSFGLTTVNEIWRDADYLAAAGSSHRGSSYSVTRCDGPSVSGFHSDTISAAGTPRRIIPPGDFEVLERFVGVGAARGPAPAIDVALEARRQIHHEPWITLAGTVTPTLAATASVTLPLSITALLGDVPRSAAVIGPDGRFSMRVPAPHPSVPASYTLVLEMFGKPVLTQPVDVTGQTAVTVTLARPEAASVTLDVTLDGAPRDAQVFFAPADEVTRAAVEARFLANFGACAPLLGPLHGASPACNRALVRGPTTVLVPPGRYRLRATAGLTASLAEAVIDAREGQSQRVPLALVSLPILPAGVLSADFHVHGGASFDSAIPDRTRVQALLAAGLDVVASTDHDVVSRFGGALEALGAQDRLHLMTGIETTALVLHEFVPDESVPKVIGHWNFWPVTLTPASPYRGGVWDEKIEPGTLFERMRQTGGLSADGIIQLNHPFTPSDFGRDLGYPQAIGFTTAGGLPARDDGSAQALINRVPPASTVSNLGYHAQEVMNGTDNVQLLAYRAYWHYLLSQGVVRAGTANSDSHGLSDNVVGTPRNLVFGAAPYDEARFLADVRAGRIVGSNGPVIIATLRDAAGATRAPSLEAVRPTAGAAIAVEVRAPSWVPVAELRVIVDGQTARTITAGLGRASSPTAPEVVTVWRGTIALAEILPADGRDHWVSIEAGSPLPPVADLNCDGIPDTTDNDGNGVIDARDAEEFDPEDPGEGCDVEIGPARSPPPPTDPADPLAVFDAVTPGGFPFAFTAPFLIDADGGGFAGAGR